MATLLLVHGAWHGAWCWSRVEPGLRARGHRVQAIDLPGHGATPASAWRTGLGSYARAVRDAARALCATGSRPILVGHSMGGIVISQAAADEPDLFAGLLYVCAFVPGPGDSLARLGSRDPASAVPRFSRIRPPRVRFDPGGAPEVFYGRCSEEDARWASDRLVANPLWPLLQGFRPRGGATLPRAYLACGDDRAISVGHQRAMARAAGISWIRDLDTDHSPFLSTPDAFVSLVDDACADLGAEEGGA